MDDFTDLEFKAIADAAPAAMFIKNAKSEIVFMNAACEEQWGVEFAALHRTDGTSVFPPDQMAAFLAKDREVFERGQPLDFEESVWNAKLRQDRTCRTFKKPVYDDSGNPKFLVCVTVDVTDRKKMDLALLSSEQKLRALFEMAPLGMALTTMGGRYVEFNEAFCRICGYTREELLALDYWTLTPKEYAAEEERQLAELERSGRYGPYEKSYVRKDGARVPLRLNGCLIRGSDGERYIWSIVEDVTRDREIAREQERAREAAEAGSRAKSTFLATISHELRTPLNAIIGFSDALSMSIAGPLNAKQAEYAGHINSAGRYLQSLIDSVLDMTQIESGRLSVAIEDVPVGGLLESVREMLQDEALRRNVDLSVVCEEGLAARADALRLKQVVLNLATNAIRYAGTGIGLRIEARAQGPAVRITIADNGRGMSAEQLAVAMTPFERGAEGRQSTTYGIGLGLPLSISLIEAQGGRISVESAPKSGTRIEIELPRAGGLSSLRP